MSDETAAPTNAATPGDTSTPAPSAPVGQPSTAPAPAAQPNAQPSQFTYKEDRSNWVPPHVQRRYVDEAQRYQRELEYERQRVAALSGVKPPAPPPDPEADAIRQQFLKLFPEMKELMDARDKLKPWMEMDPKEIQELRTSQQQAWELHGGQVLDLFEQKLRTAYGSAELKPEAVAMVQRMFVSTVETDPDLRARYDRGDLRVIDDFINAYKQGLLDPFHRSTTAAAAPVARAAARLPRGGGASAITGPKPPTVKPSDGEAFHKAAFDRFNQG